MFIYNIRMQTDKTIICLLVVTIILLILTLCKQPNKVEFMSDDNDEAVAMLSSLFNKKKMTVDNIDITNNLSVKGSTDFLPKGSIIIWMTNNIPDGWARCDGQNGTPDMRGRYITMANTGAPNTKYERRLKFTAETNSTGAHTHKFPSMWFNNAFGSGGSQGIDRNTSADIDLDTTQSSGNHSHTVSYDTKPELIELHRISVQFIMRIR